MPAIVYHASIICVTYALDGKVVSNVKQVLLSMVRHVNVTNFSMRPMTSVTHVIPVVPSAMVQITTNVHHVEMDFSNRSTLTYVLTDVQQAKLKMVN
jgi:hypothetical protein